MNKTTLQFATVTENNIVTQIGKSVIFQPKINFRGGSVKWVDDSKYLKKDLIKE